jgi:probable DNA repair protein
LTAYRQGFERAVAAAAAGATVLTANTRSARAIHAAVGERLRKQSAVWLSPDVLPFGAFLERLFSDAVVAGAITLQALRREQELQLWRQIIERSPAGLHMLLPDAAAALAAEAFRTAIEHGIRLDSPQMSASSDTRAFSGWATEFQRQLAAHSWTCPALFTRELAACLSTCPQSSLPQRTMSLPEQLFTFVPCTTPAQRRFLDALAESGVQVTASPEYSSPLSESAPYADGAAPTPVRYEFDGVGDELRAAAQWARRQLVAAPQARIGVIFFDLDRKLSQVESAFRSVLHPEQMLGQRTSSAFEIASPSPLAAYPVVRCALQLLSLFASPIGFHEFHAMLSSPYFAASPEAVARFVAEVRKDARRKVSLHDFAQSLTDPKLSSELPALRAAFESLPKHAQFSSEQPVAYWADVSRQILRAFGWPDGVSLNSEEFQCTESWRDLLSAISALELLEWRTDFRGYVARLERVASSQNFKPETLNAPVQIMDLAESEGSLFDALWIGSSSDDLWPDSPRTTPLIPVALLKEAGAAVVGTPQAAARVARITATLLQSAPQLVLSLARNTDDEREQRWSPSFARIPLSTAPVELPLPLAQQFESVQLDELSDFSAPALAFGERAHGGTSLLQDQSNCPFRAFAIRRLLAREPQGPNESLAPTERGNIFDRALQLIWEELKDSTGLARPDLAAVIATAVDGAMESELPSSWNASGHVHVNGATDNAANGDASNDAWTVRFRSLERKRTIDVLTAWLSLEATRKPFHVLGHQLDVELALGGITLHGRLDRLDEVGGEHVVIDYKTGASNNVSAWQVPRPRLPQLPFYALAMRRQHFNLAGISFAVLRRGDCAFKGYLRDKELLPCPDPTRRNFDGLPFDEYSLRWAEELERIATAFAQGDAAVDPKFPAGNSNSPCQYCHLASLCRVGDVAIDDSDGESDGVDDE